MYPTTIDDLSTTRGMVTDTLLTKNHVTHHTAEDTAITALETKVGVDGSAVQTTHDFKLSGVVTGDKAVSLTGVETLTNKTLTSPKLNFGSDATGDIYYRNSSGNTARLPVGTNGQILQVTSGNPAWITNASVSSATSTTLGVVEIATQSEVVSRTTTGGAGTLAVSPAQLTTVKTYDYVVDTGTSSAYAIAPTPAVTSMVTGQKFTFKALNTNTVSNPTLAVSGLTPIAFSGVNIGDIVGGKVYTTTYDGSNFLLNNQVQQSAYSVNADETVFSWHTLEVPIQAAYTGLSTTYGLAGWTSTSGTGLTFNSPTQYAGAFNLGTSGGIMCIVPGLTTASAFYDFSKGIRVKWRVAFNGGMTGLKAFGISSSPPNFLANQTTTGFSSVRFFFNGTTVFAVHSNNTISTTTTLTGITGTDYNLYEFVYIPGVATRFYVNGVLKVTQTTNLPQTTAGNPVYLYFADQNAQSPIVGYPIISIES